MNKDFSRIITLLRKERGLSQKQVADELNISQALLSHYEKGIRECGLDFLVRVASYYNVSCDYLLGRTPERNGATISIEDIPEYNEQEENAKVSQNNMLALLNKKLIINTTSVIFDMLSNTSSKKLTNSVSNYLINANYYIFRKLYSADNESPQAMFSVADNVYQGLSRAIYEIEDTTLSLMLHNKKDRKALRSSPDIIETEHPKEAGSLFNLIQNAEKNIKHKI